MVEELEREAVGQGLLQANGLYRFYEAAAAGDDLVLFDGGRGGRALPLPAPGDGRAALPLRLRARAGRRASRTTSRCSRSPAGRGCASCAERWKEEGEYLRSHALQALAIETAEAFAEMLHARLRTQWGFPDPPGLPLQDKLKAHYRGIRVSFGYPACPDLSDQRILFDLLRPEQVGLGLTEGFMMDPEASVSALVFHHPEAKYFKAE